MARNKWTWLAILCLLILVPGCSGGGGGGGGVSTATVTGTVHYNNTLLKGVTVYLKRSGAGSVSATTDPVTGIFTFFSIVPGDYQASCAVDAGVTITCPEVEGQYKAVTLGTNDFSIGQSSPPGVPEDR